MEYYIDNINSTSTQLTTSVQGYLQSPPFSFLTYRYLLIFQSNSIVPAYLRVETVRFSYNIPGLSDVYAVNITKPTHISSWSSIECHIMLRDIKVRYDSSWSSSGYYYISSYCYVNTFSTPNYIQAYVYTYSFSAGDNYQLRYFVVAYDSQAVSQDLPQYRF